MGTSADEAWAAIIRDVQRIVQLSGTAEESAAATVEAIMHIKGLDQQPPTPRATWENLVADLKVGCVAP